MLLLFLTIRGVSNNFLYALKAKLLAFTLSLWFFTNFSFSFWEWLSEELIYRGFSASDSKLFWAMIGESGSKISLSLKSDIIPLLSLESHSRSNLGRGLFYPLYSFSILLLSLDCRELSDISCMFSSLNTFWSLTSSSEKACKL